MKNKKKNIVTPVVIGILVALCVFCGSKCYTATAKVKNAENKVVAVQKELDESQKKLQSEIEKNNELSKELDGTKEKLKAANKTIKDLKDSEYELVYMGDFKITHYCDGRYNHVCGGNGITASGKPTKVGLTAAADWGVLPKGSMIYISGIGWREIQDVGGSVNGKHIDVLVQKHQDALALGVKHKDVWLLLKQQ